MKKIHSLLIPVLTLSLLAGCGAASGGNSASAGNTQTVSGTEIQFSDGKLTASSVSGVTIDGTALTITDAGTYVLSGSCADGSVKVEKGVDGVTLVLNGLTLTSETTAPILCGKGSAVTIEAASGTENTLSDTESNNDETGSADAENAVIKCKDGSQVVLCGAGTLNIQANGKNGIKSGATTADGEASLTICELTLNIDAPVNDAVNAEAALEVESGVLTLSTGDDALHCDYTLNIGAEGTDGPKVTITSCNEGLEGAAVNVFSGNVSIQSTDDCINAANADLTDFAYALNIYGGTIAAHSDSGDGFDSNGDLTISGGSVTVWTANAADNEPLDADGTVLSPAAPAAGGSSGMGMNLVASQPCVIFSGAAEMPGGNMQNGQPEGEERSTGNEQPNGGERPDGEGQPAQGGFPGGASLLTQGGTFTVADSNGTALYTGEAVYNASFVFFSSGDLSEGESYTLSSGETQTESATQTGTVSTGMGNMGGPGGQKPDGAPPSGGGGGPKPDDDTPRSKPTGEMPQKDSGNAKA
ncbi:MAG: carbohydrate-binding domain-containing protein [Dysosmobacter sp.]